LGASRALFVSVAFGPDAAIPQRLAELFNVSAFDPFTQMTSRLTYRAVSIVGLVGKHRSAIVG
jgi:hypothetical protein